MFAVSIAYDKVQMVQMDGHGVYLYTIHQKVMEPVQSGVSHITRSFRFLISVIRCFPYFLCNRREIAENMMQPATQLWYNSRQVLEVGTIWFHLCGFPFTCSCFFCARNTLLISGNKRLTKPRSFQPDEKSKQFPVLPIKFPVCQCSS